MIPWYAPLARAVPALVLAVLVSLSLDHTATVGLLSFGIFAVVSGTGMSVFALRAKHGTVRTIQLLQGIITAIAGVVALVTSTGGLAFFLFLLSTWAAVTGALELYLGIRGRGTYRSARDWIFVGALTALLAIVVVLVPPGYTQPYVVSDVEYQLTASIIVVGLFGAYLAVIGVYLVIAALSLKWAPEPATVGSDA